MNSESASRRMLLISNSTLHGSGYLDHAAVEIGSFLGDVERVLFVPYALYDHDAYALLARERFRTMGYELDSIHLAKELLAAANRQCPDVVRVDQVAHIEARIATIDLEVERIEDGQSGEAAGGFAGGSQIQRMAERVVKIELQVFGEPLPEVDLRRVIIRGRERAVGPEGRILWLDEG